MPAGNGTGPNGAGPMTGRAAGFCAGFGLPGYANPIGQRGYFGMGRGMGRRGGWGRRNPFHYRPQPQPQAYPQQSPQQELAALKQQAEFMKGSLEEINQRISELE